MYQVRNHYRKTRRRLHFFEALVDEPDFVQLIRALRGHVRRERLEIFRAVRSK